MNKTSKLLKFQYLGKQEARVRDMIDKRVDYIIKTYPDLFQCMSEIELLDSMLGNLGVIEEEMDGIEKACINQ